MNVLYHSDCLDILRMLPDGSVDMILQDPPYNMTACKWECDLDFPALWTEWERVIKNNGAIVMTASQPFTTTLINSGKAMFRYCLVWEKSRPSNFLLANKQPLKYHEDICIFYRNQPTYNPEKTKGERNHRSRPAYGRNNIVGDDYGNGQPFVNTSDEKFPSSVLKIQSTDSTQNEHPTQKPVDLFRYLIRTYTNEGETVFDGYGGSGTTAVACIKENRKYIVCEKEAEYIEVAKKQIDEATRQGDLFLSAVGCSPRDL